MCDRFFIGGIATAANEPASERVRTASRSVSAAVKKSPGWRFNRNRTSNESKGRSRPCRVVRPERQVEFLKRSFSLSWALIHEQLLTVRLSQTKEAVMSHVS